MTQASETSSQKSDTEEVRQQLKGKHVCPFCGVIRGDQGQPCPRCTMEDTLATRQGTRQRIGPWYVMQARNPSAPGMKFATLVSLVKKGHVTPRSIVRGPTTHQLWSFAAKVRGLSRELGLCHHCGDPVEQTVASCGACGRLQEPPADPDVLMENQSGLPELNLSTPTNPETNLDSGRPMDNISNDVTGLVISKAGRPATPSINQPSSTGRPAQPSNNARAEEAILSARELAAAFQLDFKPKKPAPSAARVSPAIAPSAKPIDPPTPVLDEEPTSGWGKWVVLILFLALAASVVMVFMKPEWKIKLQNAWETAKSNIDKPAPAQVVPLPAIVKPIITANSEKPEVKTYTPAQPEIAHINAKPVIDVEETKPEPVVEKKEEPKPAPPPVAKVEVKKPVIVEETFDDSKLNLDQAAALGKQLRNRAIDLEDAGQWHEALNLYQRIEKLPKDAWPLDLKTKLQRAQSRAK